MDEQEWLSAKNPNVLVAHLCKLRRNRTKANRRKFWLFACACCRCHWPLFEVEPTASAMIVAAERYAEGDVSFDEVVNCDRQLNVPNHGQGQSIFLAARSLAYTNVHVVATGAAQHCASAACHGLVYPNYVPIWRRELSHFANLVRDIFGNPFRPIVFDPIWRTSDAVALARGIYDDRAFDRMPILADALQDAGCDNDDVLNHCRADTVHARGCWVVDCILGKS